MATDFQISIPTRNASLDAAATLHAGHVIRVYDCGGSLPASPSDAVSGYTLLATFTESDDGATGLNMDSAAADGVLVKDATESWEATVVATGTAEMYRFSALTDAGGSSTTEARVQGTVGIVNADLLFDSVDFVIGQEKRIDSYVWGQPEEA